MSDCNFISTDYVWSSDLKLSRTDAAVPSVTNSLKAIHDIHRSSTYRISRRGHENVENVNSEGFCAHLVRAMAIMMKTNMVG
jgi:hypothetical protein